MWLVLTVGSVLAAAASLAIGSNPLPIDAIVAGLLDPARDASSVVWGSRVPRTVLGLLVGACLGIAGAVMQGQTRNPLADPGIFGVSAGAALAIVLSAAFLPSATASTTMWFALLGALIASAAVFGIALAGSSAASPVPLAIAGAAVSAFLGAGVSFFVQSNQASLTAFRMWAAGSLAGNTLDVLAQVWPFAVAGILLAAMTTRGLDALALGNDLATALGTGVVRTRLVGIASVTLLTATAVTVAGPIGFIGLTAPHLARLLAGHAHARLLPAAGATGAIVLVAADTIGRILAGMREVPVGVALAVLGGAVFIVIVRRTKATAL